MYTNFKFVGYKTPKFRGFIFVLTYYFWLNKTKCHRIIKNNDLFLVVDK